MFMPLLLVAELFDSALRPPQTHVRYRRLWTLRLRRCDAVRYVADPRAVETPMPGQVFLRIQASSIFDILPQGRNLRCLIRYTRRACMHTEHDDSVCENNESVCALFCRYADCIFLYPCNDAASGVGSLTKSASAEREEKTILAAKSLQRYLDRTLTKPVRNGETGVGCRERGRGFGGGWRRDEGRRQQRRIRHRRKAGV